MINKKIYVCSRKEKQFYEKLKIRKWKEKVPEIGHFTGFRKNKVAEPKNPLYIQRFLNEICYGKLGHFVSVFTGFILLTISFILPNTFHYGLYIAIINGILNIFPIWF